MRFLSLLFLITMLAGCKSTVGPLASKKRDPRPDPLFNSEEQQRWGRERYPYYVEDPRVAPRTFNDKYGPTGR
jgi:hypothetical protein